LPGLLVLENDDGVDARPVVARTERHVVVEGELSDPDLRLVHRRPFGGATEKAPRKWCGTPMAFN